MPYCTNCGNEVTTNMPFCHACGSKLIIPTAERESIEPQDYTADEEIIKEEDKPQPRVRKGKLYNQWVNYAGLPNDSTPSMRSPGDMATMEGGKTTRPYLLYAFLGVAIAVCIGLIFLLTESW